MHKKSYVRVVGMKYANHLNGTEISHLSLFFGVFILSSLSILVGGKEEILQSGILDRNNLSLFHLQNIDRIEMLFYVLRERGFILPVLFLLATTYLGKVAGYLCCVWYGVGIGVITGIVLLRYGMGGLFLLVCSAFPQYLFYVPAFLLSIKFTRSQRRMDRKLWIQLLLMELLIVMGCLVESYINPTLMGKIIKLYGVR